MALPRVLLADDSEVVLAFGRASLSGQCEVSVVRDGAQALAALARERFDLAVLDLSMPQMAGDEILRRLQADPALAGVPVVVASSERARGEACLRAGARAFLAKPVAAADLRATVARVLAQVAREQRAGTVAALPIEAGGQEFLLPLDAVVCALHRPLLSPRPLGEAPLVEELDWRGEKVPVLDLARLLGRSPRAPLDERKLVLLRDPALLALSVDAVHEPGEWPRHQGPARTDPPTGIRGLVDTPAGPRPLLEPRALLAPGLDRARLEALEGT